MAVGISLIGKYWNFELTGLRKLCSRHPGKRWVSQYFITTPIFYVNAEPHIGHLYTACLADAMVRYQKLKDPTTQIRFMVGTDEHGLKVSQSARKMQMETKKFCNEITSKYKSLFNLFSIDWDDFVRTTEDRHCETAIALWKKIASQDLIYKEEYSGWYCIADEMFVAEFLLEPPSDGSISDTSQEIRYTIEGKKPVHYISETNYKFRLSKFQQELLHWLDRGNVVKPLTFQKILHEWIVEGDVLKDISISRPSNRVPWGIPVPDDPTQTMYVWFDALSSYLTTNGYPNSNFKWPPDEQVIGKDILKFHGVFWPAFLMAAGLEPPKSLFCHCHWLKDNEKISKSKGNIIDPFKEEEKYTSDGFRYFLLREGVPHNDGNFTEIKVTNILNSELANTFGNLLSRCTGSAINRSNVFPGWVDRGAERFADANVENLMNSITELPALVQAGYDKFHFYEGIDAIFATLRLTNKFFDDKKPWKLVKNAADEDELRFVLHLTMESLRVCGILLQPIIPNLAKNLLDTLCVHPNNRSAESIRPFSWDSPESSSDVRLNCKKSPLFTRLKSAG